MAPGLRRARWSGLDARLRPPAAGADKEKIAFDKRAGFIWLVPPANMGELPVYNLVEAADAVGMSKNGVLKAIRRGALSASRTENGGWCIDPAELHRVYPPKVTELTPVSTSDTILVEVRGRLAAAEQTIEDLRHRLDEERSERRQVQAQLTSLLTDQRPARRRWWRR